MPIHDARGGDGNGKSGVANPRWCGFCCLLSSARHVSPLISRDDKCYKEQYKTMASKSSEFHADWKKKKNLDPDPHPHAPAVGVGAWLSSNNWPNWCCLPRGLWRSWSDQRSDQSHVRAMWARKTKGWHMSVIISQTPMLVTRDSFVPLQWVGFSTWYNTLGLLTPASWNWVLHCFVTASAVAFRA